MKLLTVFSLSILGMSITGLLRFLNPDTWAAVAHALANIVTAIVSLIALYRQFVIKDK